jgi:hypothetical protein
MNAHPSPYNIYTKRPQIHQSTTTTAMTIPASFSTATLFPCAAIRVRRPALPFSDVEREEKVSLWVVG